MRICFQGSGISMKYQMYNKLITSIIIILINILSVWIINFLSNNTNYLKSLTIVMVQLNSLDCLIIPHLLTAMNVCSFIIVWHWRSSKEKKSNQCLSYKLQADHPCLCGCYKNVLCSVASWILAPSLIVPCDSMQCHTLTWE